MMFFYQFQPHLYYYYFSDMSQSERKHIDIDDFYIFNSYDKIDI